MKLRLADYAKLYQDMKKEGDVNRAYVSIEAMKFIEHAVSDIPERTRYMNMYYTMRGKQ
jgi:hypothetical protein